MSDDQTAAAPPAGTDDQPQAGTPSPADTLSLEEARKLRKEHQQLRALARDLEAKVQAAEAEKLSTLERLQRERDQAVAERDAASRRERQAVMQSALAEAGRQAGAHSPESMWRLVDPESLEFDEQGRIINLEDVLAATRATYPTAFRGPGSADGGAGRGGDATGKVDINAALRQLSGRPG